MGSHKKPKNKYRCTPHAGSAEQPTIAREQHHPGLTPSVGRLARSSSRPKPSTTCLTAPSRPKLNTTLDGSGNFHYHDYLNSQFDATTQWGDERHTAAATDGNCRSPTPHPLPQRRM
jgi:hypothetical protein